MSGDPIFFYYDKDNQKRGPFAAREMDDWTEQKFFVNSLRIIVLHYNIEWCTSLGQILDEFGRSSPFSACSDFARRNGLERFTQGSRAGPPPGMQSSYSDHYQHQPPMHNSSPVPVLGYQQPQQHYPISYNQAPPPAAPKPQAPVKPQPPRAGNATPAPRPQPNAQHARSSGSKLEMSYMPLIHALPPDIDLSEAKLTANEVEQQLSTSKAVLTGKVKLDLKKLNADYGDLISKGCATCGAKFNAFTNYLTHVASKKHLNKNAGFVFRKSELESLLKIIKDNQEKEDANVLDGSSPNFRYMPLTNGLASNAVVVNDIATFGPPIAGMIRAFHSDNNIPRVLSSATSLAMTERFSKQLAVGCTFCNVTSFSNFQEYAYHVLAEDHVQKTRDIKIPLRQLEIYRSIFLEVRGREKGTATPSGGQASGAPNQGRPNTQKKSNASKSKPTR